MQSPGNTSPPAGPAALPELPAVSAEALGQLFNLTSRRVQQLARDEVIPRATRGRYPLVESVQGYVRFLQERVSGENISELNRELREQQVRRARLDNDEREERLVPMVEIEEVLVALGVLLAQRLDALPGRVAPVVASIDDSGECLEELRKETDALRNDIAGNLEGMARAGSNGARRRSADTAKRTA